MSKEIVDKDILFRRQEEIIFNLKMRLEFIKNMCLEMYNHLGTKDTCLSFKDLSDYTTEIFFASDLGEDPLKTQDFDTKEKLKDAQDRILRLFRQWKD
jgi:hypothetical protein